MHDDLPEPLDQPRSGSPEEALPPAHPAEEGKRVRRRDLLNLLNFINFREGSIFVGFRPLERGEPISIQAFPRPCKDEILDCRWLSPGVSMSRMKTYACEGFTIDDGGDRVTVKAEVIRLDAEGISFRIPESGYEKSARRVERHVCEGIEARLIQSGLSFEGRLADFNALSFKVEIEAPPAGSLRWINPTAPITALFSRKGELLYSGECLITRMERGLERRSIVLSPDCNNVRRYRPKGFRSERHVLSPAPALSFLHPFTGKRVYLQVKDISGAGLCVEESFEQSILLPGMILPELSIEIANRFILKCKAQVLYRNVVHCEGRETTIRCGIVLLDMSIQDQETLSAILHQTLNDKLRVCGSVDLDELWRFFFETGFIYPSKYLSIEAHKEEFKRTYKKLYLDSPSIARHFIFQDKGRLFGHMSMIRYYSNSWLIHHHAASRDGHAMAGIGVLEEAGRYCNDFHSHPSTHMDYLMCYFRKENRFPARVFGNIARDIDDPKGSSLDTFAYLGLPSEGENEGTPFQLFPAGDEDFGELRRYYEEVSGGLLLEALDLRMDEKSDLAISAEYAQQGFKRERHVFSLKQDGSLVAILTLTLSDLGLNLSNLTNCAHVFIIDGEKLQPTTLFSGLRTLLRHYGAEGIPILAYPADYLDKRGIPYEKRYILWVVNLDHSDGYFSSLRNTFRRTRSDSDAGQHSDR
ncbi:MAG: hypothetical protein ACLQMF_03805 [Rectinemataceae bacterium]